jgi:hypothetical protein
MLVCAYNIFKSYSPKKTRNEVLITCGLLSKANTNYESQYTGEKRAELIFN